MKKRSIKNIFLISFISIFLLVFNILIKKYLFIYAESIMAAFMLLVIGLTFQLLGFQKDKNNRFKNNLFFQIGQILAAYYIVIYLLGIYFGFTTIVFSLKPFSILNNTFAPIIIFICLELFRYIVTNSNRDNKKIIIFFNFIIGLIELSISVKYLQFNNLEMAYKSIADYIIPISVKQIALGLLCYYGGMKPLFLFRMIMVAYVYVVPLHPNFNETILCMSNIILPVLIIIKVNELVDEEKEEKDNNKPKKDIYEYATWTIGTVVLVSLLILVSGITPVGITAIASESMNPTFSKGAGVITIEVKEDKLKEGDIISFNHDNKQIVHRIDSIEVTDEEIRYYTKGDANSSVDEGYITYKDINNKVLFSIPLIGYPSIIIGEIFSR